MLQLLGQLLYLMLEQNSALLLLDLMLNLVVFLALGLIFLSGQALSQACNLLLECLFTLFVHSNRRSQVLSVKCCSWCLICNFFLAHIVAEELLAIKLVFVRFLVRFRLRGPVRGG